MNHGTLWSSEATRSVSERFVGEDDGEDDGVEEVEFVYIPDSRFPCNYDDYHIRVRIRVKGLVKQTRRPHQGECEILK